MLCLLFYLWVSVAFNGIKEYKPSFIQFHFKRWGKKMQEKIFFQFSLRINFKRSKLLNNFKIQPWQISVDFCYITNVFSLYSYHLAFYLYRWQFATAIKEVMKFLVIFIYGYIFEVVSKLFISFSYIPPYDLIFSYILCIWLCCDTTVSCSCNALISILWLKIINVYQIL